MVDWSRVCGLWSPDLILFLISPKSIVRGLHAIALHKRLTEIRIQPFLFFAWFTKKIAK